MGKASWTRFCIKSAILWLVTLLLWPSAWAAAAGQQVTTVYAVGNSIGGADMSTGREEAVADGLVAALAQTINALVPPETIEGHFQALSESIFSNTDQFISDYQILTEATHGRTQRVLIKATISEQRLKDALKRAGIYLGRKQLPQVLLCIAEKQIGDLGYQYWWNGQPVRRAGVAEEAIAEIIKNKGFNIVNPRMDTSMGAYPPELSVPEAVALGQQMQAEVVVVGQAVAEETSNTMEGSAARSFRATVAARAYSVRNGRQIARTERMVTITGEDPVEGGRQALKNAAQLAGGDLAAQMTESWFSGDIGRSKLELAIEGISGHIADFVKLRGALSSISGVDDVQRKEIQADKAVLLVDFQGSPRALVDALMRQSFNTFGLDIAQPEGNVIRIKIVPR